MFNEDFYLPLFLPTFLYHGYNTVLDTMRSQQWVKGGGKQNPKSNKLLCWMQIYFLYRMYEYL
jgi:hypothetical protein